jgi:salicylate hydroxylase
MTLVGIVGGGIGGLAAALSLQRAGIEAVVYEQASALGEVGAGIQISPNASRVLHQLGLADSLARVAVRPVTGDLRRWEDWSLLTSQPLGEHVEAQYGYPYYHVHRAHLHALLADQLPVETVRLEHRCVGVEVGTGGAKLWFEGGSRERCDIAIGADGIRSFVREALLGPQAPRYSGVTAWRGLVPAERVADLHLPVASTAVLGAGRHFVHYYVAAGRLVNWVAVAPSETWMLESWTAPGDVEEALDDFAGWTPVVRRLIGEVSESALFRWALYDRDPLLRWGDGPVTLLGDAAHPMLPFMAQGAAQAIEDGSVLARCLARIGDPIEALRHYEDLRRDRTARVQLAARQNAVLFHLPDGPEQQERDTRLKAQSGAQATHRNAWVFDYDIEEATAHL